MMLLQAKVFAAPTAAPKAPRSLGDAAVNNNIANPEVFAFQWLLSSKIVLLEDV